MTRFISSCDNKFDGDFTKETKLELIKQIKLGLENGVVKHHQKVLEREKEWSKKKTDFIMESNKKVILRLVIAVFFYWYVSVYILSPCRRL